MAEKIIFFDGLCNLCNNTVQFVIKRDRKKQFSFASLQSAAGRQMLLQNNLPLEELSSFILQENGQVYIKSTGALRVAKSLDGFWPLLSGLIIVPKFIRDRVYNWIASNRYKWFGKQESCWLPTPDLRNRFLQ